MSTHEHYIKACITLAAKGLGYTAPNPMVGSIIVLDNIIIGEGYHERHGQAHAEVNAINSVMDKTTLKNATLYVNLEPCNHYGKTPPCSNLIIEHKIKKVIIGATDPYPEVNGSGIQKLKDAGVEVITGVLEQECKELNRRFYTFNVQQKPYIILKWAQTANGFVGVKNQVRGNALKITNAKTNQLVHLWRAQEQAIMVGKNTVLLDNPMLSVRHVEGRQPLPIILTDKKNIPTHYKIHDNDPWFITTSKNQLHDLYQFCIDKKIQSVLVEGGPTIQNWIIEKNSWDEIRMITNTDMKIEAGIPAPVINSLPLPAETHWVDNDKIEIFYNTRTW